MHRRPPLPWFALSALAGLSVACVSPRSDPAGGVSRSPGPPPAREPVVIDGSLAEWGGHHVVAHDSAAAPGGAAVDLTTVRERQDSQYVYLQLDFRSPVSLLSLPGTLSLAVDADGDSATGATLDGLRGADFAVDWSPRDSTGRPVEGVALRVARPGGAVRRADAHGVGLVTLPGMMSAGFELRLARGVRAGGASPARLSFTGASYRARVVFRDVSGTVRDAVPDFTVSIDSPYRADGVPEQDADPVRRENGTVFRVLQWNTADHGLIDRPEVFRRIIRALDPDVLLLHEVNGRLGREGMARFLASLDTASRKLPWHFSFGAGGGYQRSIVASRNAVTEYADFRFVPYPGSLADSLVAMAPPASRERLRTSLEAGVPTGGAVVEIGGRRLAAFSLDLQSAGNDPRSWQERRRRAEARIIRERVRSAVEQAPPADGVVIAGDFNLVATDSALRTLLLPGVAPHLEPMTVVDARQLDGRTAATWDAGSGPFTPGRLDWFLYGRASLHVRRAFVFDTRDLSDRWLAVHGLRREDSDRASDHMPIVVDFSWTP